MIRLIFSQTVPKQPISLLKNFFLHFVSSLFNNLKKNNSENVSTNLKKYNSENVSTQKYDFKRQN